MQTDRRRALSEPERGTGATPLHWAAARASPGGLTCVEYLLDAGCETGARDRYGCTPLHWAAKGGSVDIGAMICTHRYWVHSRRLSLSITSGSEVQASN